MIDLDLKDNRPLKEKVREVLRDSNTTVSLVVDSAIALLILLSAALFAIQTYPLPVWLRAGLEVIDQIILALFTLEYALRLWSAKRPLRFVISLYGLIDLIAILPFILDFFDTRFLRLIRWLRILRLARILDRNIWFNRLNNYESAIFARILFTLFSIVFIYSGAIYQAEHGANSQDFGTFLDAVYFSVVTMTTVGFGDITPITEAGRGLTIAMIMTGVALVPTQVGNLIRQFVKVRGSTSIICDLCALADHESDAQFCRRCGAPLPDVPHEISNEASAPL